MFIRPAAGKDLWKNALVSGCLDGDTHVEVLEEEVVGGLELLLHEAVRRGARERRAREESEDPVTVEKQAVSQGSVPTVHMCMRGGWGKRRDVGVDGEGNSPGAEGANGLASGERGRVGREPARRLEAARPERAASKKYSRVHRHVSFSFRVLRWLRLASGSKSVGPLKGKNKEKKRNKRGVGVQEALIRDVEPGFPACRNARCGCGRSKVDCSLPLPEFGDPFPGVSLVGDAAAGLMAGEISATLTPPAFSGLAHAPKTAADMRRRAFRLISRCIQPFSRAVSIG